MSRYLGIPVLQGREDVTLKWRLFGSVEVTVNVMKNFRKMLERLRSRCLRRFRRRTSVLEDSSTNVGFQLPGNLHLQLVFVPAALTVGSELT